MPYVGNTRLQSNLELGLSLPTTSYCIFITEHMKSVHRSCLGGKFLLSREH